MITFITLQGFTAHLIYMITSRLFPATYCDTVYRLSDHRMITPVYNIHLGKYKASANYVINKGDKRNKAWINELRENPKGVFLKVHREGKSNKSGWL